MTMTIRAVSTVEFIGLSETNTIGYYGTYPETTLRYFLRVTASELIWSEYPHSNGFSGSPRGLGCRDQLAP
jgi:hypothetical protein